VEMKVPALARAFGAVAVGAGWFLITRAA